MKRKCIAILSSILTILTLGSCQNNNQGKDVLESTLESLAKGVHLEGKIDETASFLSGYQGTLTGEKTSTRYDIDYTFENRDLTGIERKVYAYEQDGTRYEWANDTLVEGEDGLAYYNELGYENKIVNVPATNGTNLDVNYGYFCDNPFRYLNASDFTKVDDNTYNLDRKKASYVASKLFSSIDEVFDEVIDSAKFTFNNNTLTNIELQPKQMETYDTFGIENRYFLLDAKAEIQVSKIGDASITRLETRPHLDVHDPLNSAFKAINDNYTLDITYNFKMDNVSQEPIYYKFYYTKDGLFWKCDNETNPTEADLLIKYNDKDDTTTPYGYDSENNKFTTSAALSNGYSQLVNAPKSLYVPIVNGVAGEIFDFDSSKNEYHIYEALKTYIGADCFVPSCASIRELNGYGTDCVIKLKQDNSLDKIDISYYRRDSFSDESGTFTLSYSNVGTTSLPYSFN